MICNFQGIKSIDFNVNTVNFFKLCSYEFHMIFIKLKFIKIYFSCITAFFSVVCM